MCDRGMRAFQFYIRCRGLQTGVGSCRRERAKAPQLLIAWADGNGQVSLNFDALDRQTVAGFYRGLRICRKAHNGCGLDRSPCLFLLVGSIACLHALDDGYAQRLSPFPDRFSD